MSLYINHHSVERIQAALRSGLISMLVSADSQNLLGLLSLHRSQN